MADIHEKTINTIRILSADMVQKANSGHPGAPMGMAPLAYALWANVLKANPADPEWKDRDRFILSSGHASAMLYSLLHLFGYGLTMDDLKEFRQWGSKTPGHPEYRHTRGVETTTGPLGQGVANAVGFAIAETMLAAHFNREGFPVVDHRTYAVCGDGELGEGQIWEAAMAAAKWKLDNLCAFVDVNGLQIDGRTADVMPTEPLDKKFEAFNWHVVSIDGHSMEAILAALKEARETKGRPTVIIAKTVKGKGVSFMEGQAGWHGKAPTDEQFAEAKAELGKAIKELEVK